MPAATAATEQRQFAELLAEVRRIPLRHSRFVTDVLTGGYRSTFRGVGVEFEEVREYSEGDDPRHVDWNVTARVGRPFIKRFVEEREHTLVFAVDASLSMRAGAGAWSKTAAAARFCAMLGMLAIANNDRVGLVIGGAGADAYVPPRKGARHVLSIVRETLRHRVERPQADLEAMLREVARRQRRRAVVFLVSDFEQLEYGRALDYCARRHDLVAVRLVAPELHDPPRAMLRIAGPGAPVDRVIDLADPLVRLAWLERCALLRRRLGERFESARADLLEIAIPWQPDMNALALPVQQFFRQRERREIYR